MELLCIYPSKPMFSIPTPPNRAIFRLLKPPAKPLTHRGAPATRVGEGIRTIEAGIRESRFDATVGIQLRGHI